jgi:hypothetical protein
MGKSLHRVTQGTSGHFMALLKRAIGSTLAPKGALTSLIETAADITTDADRRIKRLKG